MISWHTVGKHSMSRKSIGKEREAGNALGLTWDLTASTPGAE